MSSFGRTADGVEGIIGGIEIPTYGCWQVAGHFQEQELTFTVWVAPRSGSQGSDQVQLATRDVEPPPIVKVDGADEAKLLVYSLTPEVPPGARSANVSGTVVLHAIIDRDGRPEQLEYVSGPPELAQAAIDAAQWQQYRIYRDEEIDTAISIVFPPEAN